MSPTEALTLGRRALAAGFAWAPGVAGISRPLAEAGYHRLRCLDDEGNGWAASGSLGGWTAEGFDIVPDFRDAASVGVLESQVRERYGDDSLFARQSGGGCACLGCADNAGRARDVMAYDEWKAWTLRHPQGSPVPYVEEPRDVDPLTLPLAERLRRRRGPANPAGNR